MLVAIQLMHCFRIPGAFLANQIVVGPETQWKTFPRNWIAMPVDIRSQVHLSISQKFNAVLAETLCFFDRSAFPFRKARLDELSQSFSPFRTCGQIKSSCRTTIEI